MPDLAGVGAEARQATPRAWRPPGGLAAALAMLYLTALAAGFLTAPWELTPPPSPVRLGVLTTAVHNLRIIALIFLGGAALAVPTVVVGIWNGFITGALLAEVAPTPNWFMAILAHGIPEATAQWCAMVGGVELLLWLWRCLRGGSLSAPLRALSWAGVAVLATCLAAVVEGTVSPFIVEVLTS